MNKIKNLLFGSLRNQIIFGGMAVYTFFMSVFIYDVISRQEMLLVEHQREHGIAMSKTFMVSAADLFEQHDIKSLHVLTESQKNFPELIYAGITDLDGKVIAHTDEKLIGTVMVEVLALPNKTILGKMSDRTEIAMPIIKDGKKVGWVWLAVSQKYIAKKMSAVLVSGIIHTIIAILCGTILAWNVGVKFTRRLNILIKTINQVKSGNIKARIKLNGKDEAAVLGEEINSLLDAVERSEGDLKYMNSNLETIVKFQTEELNEQLEDIEDNRETLTSLMNAITESVLLIKIDGTIDVINNTAASRFSSTSEELTGKNIFDILPTHMIEKGHSIIESILSSKVSFFFEDTLFDMFMMISVYPIFAHNSEVTKLAIFAYDMTEKKEAESIILESQTRLDLAVKSADMGVWAYDITKGKRFFDEKSCAILGLDYEEYDGTTKSFLKAIHEEDSGYVYDALKNTITSEAPYETEYRTVNADGKITYVAARGRLIKNEYGVAVNVYGILWDVTERKKLEKELKDSERRLMDIFEFLPDATFVIDKEMRVIAWNKAIERMSGVKKEDIVGEGDYAYTIPFYGERRKQMLDLIDIDDENLKNNYKNVTRVGDCLFAETFCPELYGKKGAYVWAIAAPLYDASGTRIGAIESIRDITEIKDTQANLARSNSELEQFAYIASHDLQEPLRKIAGFSELLASKYKGKLDEKADTYLHYIVDGSIRMRSLINDLLSYSRLMRNTSELVPVDSSKVLKRVLQDMEVAIRESKAEICVGVMPTVMAEEIRLGQLFQNLIGNALKYRGAENPSVQIDVEIQGDMWLFTIIDNGIGIAPEFYERVFAIFQRLHTREEYSGTGIGLAVCQKIVEQFGGKIWVTSGVGKGSRFMFTLPVYSDINNEI